MDSQSPGQRMCVLMAVSKGGGGVGRDEDLELARPPSSGYQRDGSATSLLALSFLTHAFLHVLLAISGILATARQSLPAPTVAHPCTHSSLPFTLTCSCLCLLILILPWSPFLREAFLRSPGFSVLFHSAYFSPLPYFFLQCPFLLLFIY